MTQEGQFRLAIPAQACGSYVGGTEPVLGLPHSLLVSLQRKGFWQRGVPPGLELRAPLILGSGSSRSVAVSRKGPEIRSSQLTCVSASAHLAVRPRILPAGKWPLHG